MKKTTKTPSVGKEKKESATKAILLPALALLLIAGVSSFLLAYVNSVTAPVVAAREKEATASAMAAVMPQASAFSDEKTADGYTYSEATNDAGESVGYVFTTAATGYGGEISVMTGIDQDGLITGIQILSINETPGLGMKAQDESFLSQFLGKSGQLTLSKTASGDEIQALTGATITSTAMTEAVNAALAGWQEITGGEQK